MMKITFLGTGSGSTAGSRRAKSSIMISEGEDSIILDMGNGANSNLEDLGFPDINSVFFTHLHIDHINGIFDYLVQRKIRRMKDVKIYSPPGFSKLLNTYKDLGNNISAEVYESNLPKAKIGDLEVYSVEACHAIYAVAYIITNGEKKIVYSGDTSEPCEGIIKESKDADLIIHEATCLEGCEIYGHTPLPKLKEIFDKKRVIITHIPSQIEDKYTNLGDFILAFDGLIWNV